MTCEAIIMIKKVKYYSLKHSITLAIIVFICIPLIFSGLFLYHALSFTLKNHAQQFLMTSVTMINRNLERNFAFMDDTSMLFLSNKDIRSALKKKSETPNPSLQIQKKYTIDRQLKNLLLFNPSWDEKLLQSVFIFENENTYYFISRDANYKNSIQKNLNVYKLFQNKEGEKYLLPPSANDPTLYFIRSIRDVDTFEQIGQLVLGIDEEFLNDVDQNIVQYENIEIFTFDTNGTIFSHTNPTLLGKKVEDTILGFKDNPDIHEIMINDEPYFIAIKNIDNYPLISAIAIPKKQVFLDLKNTIHGYMITIGFILFIALGIGLIISTRVIAPLKVLTAITKQIKKGNFHHQLPPSKYIELDELSTIFNKMTKEIDYLIHEVYEKQLLIKESELETLQSQVNPHFLFNVLEAIHWQAQMSGNETIDNMITSLGELLRASITLSGHEKITIQQEFEYIHFYLYLQKIRFDDELEINIRFDDESIKNYYLPKLCIQPIVENAIVHGLEEKEGIGHLDIHVFKRDTTIIFEIIDDGIGFEINNINFNHLNSISKRKKSHTSIGLYNTNKRIKLIYGLPYGVNIESTPKKGSKIAVTIPIDEGGTENVPHHDC